MKTCTVSHRYSCRKYLAHNTQQIFYVKKFGGKGVLDAH